MTIKLQKKYPWIEFEDGSVYREESKDIAETVWAGRLDEKRGAPAPRLRRGYNVGRLGL